MAKLFMIIAVRVSLLSGSVYNILPGYRSIKGIPNEHNIDMQLIGWGSRMLHDTRSGC